LPVFRRTLIPLSSFSAMADGTITNVKINAQTINNLVLAMFILLSLRKITFYQLTMRA
jgi:hypothetical protein